MKTTQNHRVITEYIKQRYGSIAKQGTARGCCDGGCSCSSSPTDIDLISGMLGYDQRDMVDVSEGANLGLGCGNPLAFASLKAGETVLDLGSGGGFDCFLARRQVGGHGKVIGVDMTREMIDLARANATRLGYSNVEFIEGSIEDLPVEDDTIDVIISNCVINLSMDKQQVFHEAYRVLKPGGRLSVSDVVATAELPDAMRQDLSLRAGCVAGAEHVAEVELLLVTAGFAGIKMTPKDTSREILSSWVPGSDIDRYVASFIIEARKPL
ncbi:MAG: methyltransferase domain-containing protein [Spirochaetia bacterium]|nr:methyltransferase domain-containing protein [Spirochaetia bacterium]